MPTPDEAVRSNSADEMGELPVKRAAANSKVSRRINTPSSVSTICSGSWLPHTADKTTAAIKSLIHPCNCLISSISTHPHEQSGGPRLPRPHVCERGQRDEQSFLIEV